MSGVRVLVGTRKGAFILTADGKRQNWDVQGPFFAGWEIYHLKGSPVNPNRIYASQSSGWFGQMIQCTDDGGKTWKAVGNKFAYEGTPGTHQWYDGTPHPWSSSASGISSPLSQTRIRFTPAWKMRAFSAPRMQAKAGRNCPGCAPSKATCGRRSGRNVPAHHSD